MATKEKETLALLGPQVLVTENLQELHHPGRDIWHPVHTADLIKEACDTSTSARFEQREFLPCGTSAFTFHHAPLPSPQTALEPFLGSTRHSHRLNDAKAPEGRLGRLTGR